MLHCPLREFRSPYLGTALQPRRAVIPISASVYSIFMCPNNGVAVSVWDFLTCAQCWCVRFAHGGCTDTVRESALKADSGRKIPCRTEESVKPTSVRRLAFRRTLYPLGYPRPLCLLQTKPLNDLFRIPDRKWIRSRKKSTQPYFRGIHPDVFPTFL